MSERVKFGEHPIFAQNPRESRDFESTRLQSKTSRSVIHVCLVYMYIYVYLIKYRLLLVI